MRKINKGGTRAVGGSLGQAGGGWIPTTGSFAIGDVVGVVRGTEWVCEQTLSDVADEFQV